MVCRHTPHSLATSPTVRPSAMTARTALYLCSVTLISLMAGECRVGTEVLAYADLLVTDAHESIASHPSADPLLTVALGPRSQSMLRLAVAGMKAAHRGSVGQRLVRTLRVVVVNPFVQRLLRCL